MRKVEMGDVMKAFNDNNNDIEQTAKALNINKSNVYRRIKQYKESKGGNMFGLKAQGDIMELSEYMVRNTDDDMIGYENRKEYEPFKDILDNNESIMLLGEAGTGKTSMVRKYALEHKLPLLHISCDNLLEMGELFGYQGITNGNTFFTEGALIKMACNMPCVVLLDEITLMDAGKFGRLQVFIENRKFFVKEANNGQGGMYNLHKDTRIVLSGNPVSSSYSGTNRINVALMRRIKVIEMPEWTKSELFKIFSDVNKFMFERLYSLYHECNKVITNNKIRAVFTLSDLRKITSLLIRKFKIKDALDIGFMNGVKLTAGQEQYGVLKNISLAIFNDINETMQDVLHKEEVRINEAKAEDKARAKANADKHKANEGAVEGAPMTTRTDEEEVDFSKLMS